MAVVKTYLGAVKPVGEKILVNYVKADTAAASDSYDFLLDANYCVTGLEITKTGTTNTTNGNILTARVEKIDSTGAATEIAQAALGGATATSLALGAKNVAGMGNAIVTVAAGAANAANTYLDPTVLVQANTATTGTTNSKQRIRLTITSVTVAAFAPSCFVEIQVCKYSTVTQGVFGNTTTGIQVSELLSPPTV
jgi:hypothetical protein